MNKKRVFVYFAAIVLIFGACSGPWKEGDEGIFSVSIGGQNRAAWNDTAILAELAHTITLSNGPGPEQTRENVKYGDTVTFSVTPGRWLITITAFKDGEPYATGSQPVDIKSGQNGAIAIKMSPVTSGGSGGSGGSQEPGEIIKVINGNDAGEGSLRWAMESDSEVITIIISKDVSTITINSTLPAVFSENGKKSITIKAETPVTIIRGDPGFTKSLFFIGEFGQKGTLILGGNGSKAITINGNKSSVAAVESLISVDSGEFIMNEGVTLKNNIGSSGGGVCVGDGGTFTMNGGEVSDNTVNAQKGGGVYMNGGTFTMKGGTISGNFCENGGGGVWVAGGGTFTMSGGTISGNEAGGPGGGVCVYGGTFTMKSGTISGNTSYGSGGGVFVENGTFQMAGGTIYGFDGTNNSNNNNATNGGAALNSDFGTAQYGTFNGDQFTPATGGGTLTTRETTFWVEDGELKP